MYLKPIALLIAGVLTIAISEAYSQESNSLLPKNAPLSAVRQQVNDLTETILVLEKRVTNLENLVAFGSAALIPGDTKLQAVQSGSATFLLSIDKPTATEDGCRFTLTVVNPQSITYTNAGFDIRVYGKDADGDPKAFKPALLISKMMPAFDAGARTQFTFAVPGMKADNFAAAYVAGLTYGGISAPSAN